MLRELPSWSNHWHKFFRGGASLTNFRNRMGWFDQSSLSATLCKEFLVEQLEAIPGEGDHESLLDEARACADEFKYKREGWSPDSRLSSWRYRLIGKMRQQLARAAVAALEPDIIVLDEFQRFTSLLHDDNPGASSPERCSTTGTPRPVPALSHALQDVHAAR